MTKRVHNFEDSINEMRQCAEARESHERYNNELSTKISYIKSLFSEDQLRAWRQIECIIDRNTTDHDNDRSTVMKIYPEDIRKELMR